MPVSFQHADIDFKPADRPVLKKFITTSFEKETGKKLSVSYVFCSDEFLLQINRDFLKHDFYTDIITFPLSDTARKVAAEIYISIDRVRENSSRLKVSFEEELQRVTFHGILHLAGYGDKTKAEKETMRKMEDKWIRAFGQALKKERI